MHLLQSALEGGERLKENLYTMPFFSMNGPGHRLMEACYDLAWVRRDFNWQQWSGRAEARHLMEEPGALESASVADIERLLTMWMRADRFFEGYLAGVYNSGHLLRVLRRAEALERALP